MIFTAVKRIEWRVTIVEAGSQLVGSNSTLRQELMVAWSREVAVEKEIGGFAIFPLSEIESIGLVPELNVGSKGKK